MKEPNHIPGESPAAGGWSRANPPTISICIPTHGRVGLVAEAIESATNQTLLPTEVIVSDDLGDPEVQALVEAQARLAKCPIRYLRCRTGPGQAQNVNECLNAVKTDLLVLLHDDDRLRPQALEWLIEPFLVEPTLVASYGRQSVVDARGVEQTDQTELVNRSYYRVAKEEGLQECSFCAGVRGQFPNNSFLIRADVAKAVRYDPETGAATDVDFGIRCASHGRFWYVHQTTAEYRLSEDSIVRGKGRSKDNSSYQFVKILEQLHPAASECRATIAERFQGTLPAAIAQAAQLGHIADGWRWYFCASHRRQIFSPGGLRRAALLLGAMGSGNRPAKK